MRFELVHYGRASNFEKNCTNDKYVGLNRKLEEVRYSHIFLEESWVMDD